MVRSQALFCVSIKFVISRNKVVFTVYIHQMLSRIREDVEMSNRAKKVCVIANESLNNNNCNKMKSNKGVF